MLATCWRKGLLPIVAQIFKDWIESTTMVSQEDEIYILRKRNQDATRFIGMHLLILKKCRLQNLNRRNG